MLRPEVAPTGCRSMWIERDICGCRCRSTHQTVADTSARQKCSRSSSNR